MRTKPDTTPTAPALPSTQQAEQLDLDFFDTFPCRLNALAGILNAIDESGNESVQSIFFTATVSFLTTLASELAQEFNRWSAAHHEARATVQEGGAV